VASLTYKLETLAAKRASGKRAVVDVDGTSYNFVAVRWGGTSPIVILEIGGANIVHSAAEWKRLGAKLP
jgi:hypothetical protein